MSKPVKIVFNASPEQLRKTGGRLLAIEIDNLDVSPWIGWEDRGDGTWAMHVEQQYLDAHSAIAWSEFRGAGMLERVNIFLRPFGWSIFITRMEETVIWVSPAQGDKTHPDIPANPEPQ